MHDVPTFRSVFCCLCPSCVTCGLRTAGITFSAWLSAQGVAVSFFTLALKLLSILLFQALLSPLYRSHLVISLASAKLRNRSSCLNACDHGWLSNEGLVDTGWCKACVSIFQWWTLVKAVNRPVSWHLQGC